MAEPLLRTPPETDGDPHPGAAHQATRPVALAAAAAVAAALTGGVAWALITKSSDYEVGIVAWGIGFIAGTTAVFVAGRRGATLQAIAIGAALAGIALGKYLSFALVVQDEAERIGLQLGLASNEMFDLFRNLGDVFGLFDLLWVALAVASAWRIARPEAPAPAVPG